MAYGGKSAAVGLPASPSAISSTLGPATDANCSAPSTIQYVYLPRGAKDFKPLTDTHTLPAWVAAKKRPADVVDGCWVVDADTKATFVAERQGFGSKPDSTCNTACPSSAFTRYAGGPIDANVLKCQLKPIDATDYTAFSAAELARLRSIVPGGTCDFSMPGVNQTRVVPYVSERLQRT